MRAGKLTSRQLVEEYLRRIRTYDQPTRLNAIVLVNPNALAEADKLDQEFKRTGKMRPLHGIPVIVKDNYDTYDLQTTGGSLAMKGNIPPTDAFMVKKLREAGAIVSGEIEYGGVGVQSVCDGKFDRRNYAESLRPGSRAGGIERRNGGGGCGKFRNGGIGNGHGKFDSRAIVAQ